MIDCPPFRACSLNEQTDVTERQDLGPGHCIHPQLGPSNNSRTYPSASCVAERYGRCAGARKRCSVRAVLVVQFS